MKNTKSKTPKANAGTRSVARKTNPAGIGEPHEYRFGSKKVRDAKHDPKPQRRAAKQQNGSNAFQGN